jgi:hypothetical protein
MLSRILVAYEQFCTLAVLRDALLPKLLSGELCIRDQRMDNVIVDAAKHWGAR